MRRLLAVGLLFVLVAAPLPGGADKNRLSEEIVETKQRIEELEKLIVEHEATSKELAAKIAKTNQRMREVQAQLASAEAALVEVEGELSTVQAAYDQTTIDLGVHRSQLASTQAEIASTAEAVRAQAVEIYVRGGSELAAPILEVKGLGELAIGLEYADQIVSLTQQAADRLEILRRNEVVQIQRVEAEQLALDTQRAQLSIQREAAVAARAQVDAIRAEVQAELDLQKALLADVEDQISHFEVELDGQEAEQARLEQLLADTQRRAGAAPGKLLWPAQGTLTSGFGLRLHPILGYSRLHAGIDISAPSGSKIWSAAAGTVLSAGPYGAYGNAVIIDHGGGMATLYAHQSRVAVASGAEVKAGDLIGYVGSTGLSTGPHLHFEVRIKAQPVDPMQYLSG